MKAKEAVVQQQGHVVRDFYLGNTRVMICDDYCQNQTQEEVEAILVELSAKMYPHLMAQMLAERQKE